MLISLAELKGATYDRDKGVAYVKPGGEWNDVISELNKDGVAVVGGRLGESDIIFRVHLCVDQPQALLELAVYSFKGAFLS